jgi:hypothetical protein
LLFRAAAYLRRANGRVVQGERKQDKRRKKDEKSFDVLKKTLPLRKPKPYLL